MKVARRTFLLASGAFAAAPLLPGMPATAHAGRTTLRADTASAVDPALVVRIDGWSLPKEAVPSAPDELWLAVNKAWRGAWR